MIALILYEKYIIIASLMFFANQKEQAGTSAATYKMMEPWRQSFELFTSL